MRPNSSKRGYDASWQRVRAQYLQQYPYCVVCGNLGNEVDHIESIADNPSARLDFDNLRTLCKRHHSRRTIYDQGLHKGKRLRVPVGVDGLPVDPDHPWNK